MSSKLYTRENKGWQAKIHVVKAIACKVCDLSENIQLSFSTIVAPQKQLGLAETIITVSHQTFVRLI